MKISVDQSTNKYRGEWQPTTAYYEGDMVINGGILNVAITDFLSGATFDQADWTEVSCGGGGGQLHHRTVWDLSSATKPGYLSYNRKKFTTTASSTFNLINSNTFYNTSSNQPVYLELVMDYVSDGASNQVGLVWGSNQGAFHDGRFSFRMNGRIYLVYSSVNQDWNMSWPYVRGDVLRIFIQGTNAWMGYKSGVTEYVYGDPSTFSSPVTTNLPNNTNIFIGGALFGVATREAMVLHTTHNEFVSNPLGFDAWDDYI